MVVSSGFNIFCFTRQKETHRPGWYFFAVWLIKDRFCWGFFRGHIFDVVWTWHFFGLRITLNIWQLGRPDKKRKGKIDEKRDLSSGTVTLRFHNTNQICLPQLFLNILRVKHVGFTVTFWLPSTTKNVNNFSWGGNFWVSTSWQNYVRFFLYPKLGFGYFRIKWTERPKNY